MAAAAMEMKKAAHQGLLNGKGESRWDGGTVVLAAPYLVAAILWRIGAPQYMVATPLQAAAAPCPVVAAPLQMEAAPLWVVMTPLQVDV